MDGPIEPQVLEHIIRAEPKDDVIVDRMPPYDFEDTAAGDVFVTYGVFFAVDDDGFTVIMVLTVRNVSCHLRLRLVVVPVAFAVLFVILHGFAVVYGAADHSLARVNNAAKSG
jgi:hypothetical protein